MQRRINTKREALDLEAELIAQLRVFPVRGDAARLEFPEPPAADDATIAPPEIEQPKEQ